MNRGKGIKRYPLIASRDPLFPFPGPSLSKGPLSLFLISLLLLVPSCSGTPQPAKESRFMMGTIVEMVLYGSPGTTSAGMGEAFKSMSRVEDAAHPSKEGSSLLKVRDGDAIHLDGALARILETAMGVSKASSGSFDPTMGEVVNLWGFGSNDPGLPSEEDVNMSLARSGYMRVPKGQCCPKGLKIWFDLGGVAKGYAVDEAVRVLKEAGVRAGVVNAGGDLRSFGEHPRRGHWNIGVQDPNNPQEIAGILEIKESAVATSGDYQRYFEKGGVRYHHILDPATGYPARSGLRGTTVVAPDCATADALATAVFVLGPEKGAALLEAWDGAEGVLITEEGEILTTSGIGDEGIRFTESSD